VSVSLVIFSAALFATISYILYASAEDDLNPNRNRVLNEVDPDANIFLAAHTQSGDGPLLFDRLYEKL